MSVPDFGRFSDPALLILTSLAGGQKHGYSMMEDIEAISGIKLGPGTLYGALSRLDEHGFIDVIETEDRRKPYQLTAKGLKTLEETLEKMQHFTQTGLQRIEEGS
ncbi:MAG: PadR family transcriptional regulator [Phototrophicaceae bacterium]|jgi:DNA-binding PadR family transcriptional regulator